MGKRQNAFLLLHNFYSLSVFLLFLLLEFLEWYISDENHIICNYSFTQIKHVVPWQHVRPKYTKAKPFIIHFTLAIESFNKIKIMVDG